MTEMDIRAQQYAYKRGIRKYRVEGKYLIFNCSYPACGGQSRYTIQHKVDLISLYETTQRLKRYDPRGRVNV